MAIISKREAGSANMPKAKRHITLSVHMLVDTLLRKGDIDNRVYNKETMQLGSKIHASYQEAQGNSYISEMFLRHSFERENAIVTLEGRADGIILTDKRPIIDEIKSTVMDLDSFYEEQKEWHLGQACCYALMYLLESGGEEAGVRLTYISQRDNKKKIRNWTFRIDELRERVEGLIDRFLERIEATYAHFEVRSRSAKSLPFPFEDFRKGQREMAKYIYHTAKKGGFFFFEAPTGIGKTISSLYPSIKAFSETKMDRIFFLTAKNSGKQSAEKAINILTENGACIYSSTLSSKDAICLSKGSECNPDDCPFAKSYYEIYPSAREEALRRYTHFGSEEIRELALEYRICPFEFQLDLSLDSDVIIADYNYFIDPFVKLERYFGEDADPSSFFVIADEAHNIIERGRKSYSESISSNDFIAAKTALRKYPNKTIKTRISKLLKELDVLTSETKEESIALPSFPEDFLKHVERFTETKRTIQNDEKLPKLPEEVNELSRKCYRLGELIDGGYELLPYVSKKKNAASIGVLCLDPSPMLRESFSKVKGAIFLSGTLSPVDYFMEGILGEKDEPYLLLPSPFPKENFKILLAANVSTRYKDREKTLKEVADYLTSFVSSKKGNYFIYFPSFAYLKSISSSLDFGEGTNVYMQKESMDSDEKEALLRHFIPSPNESNVALLVIGGSFGEGIDLPSDRLIGVAIVGLGLPQVAFDTEELKKHYDEKLSAGFDYAYRNPGINKVMQAVGRLIRSEKDVGTALLIDDRYLYREYREVFLKHWKNYETVKKPSEIEEKVKAFYKEREK